MSRYVRDNKEFRAQIARLADAGLNLDRSTAKISPQRDIKPKGRLPEFVAGLVWWSPVIAAAIVTLHYILRGAH